MTKALQRFHKSPTPMNASTQATIQLHQKLAFFDPLIHGQERMVDQSIGAEFGNKNLYPFDSYKCDRMKTKIVIRS
jgi:hypothetical protein